ncbi:hypothetical protein D3C85_1697380 [compost metagenome]
MYRQNSAAPAYIRVNKTGILQAAQIGHMIIMPMRNIDGIQFIQPLIMLELRQHAAAAVNQ